MADQRAYSMTCDPCSCGCGNVKLMMFSQRGKLMAVANLSNEDALDLAVEMASCAVSHPREDSIGETAGNA